MLSDWSSLIPTVHFTKSTIHVYGPQSRNPSI